MTKKISNLEKDIKEAKRDYRKGDYITLQELLEKEGCVLQNDKKKIKKEFI